MSISRLLIERKRDKHYLMPKFDPGKVKTSPYDIKAGEMLPRHSRQIRGGRERLAEETIDQRQRKISGRDRYSENQE